MSALFRTTPDSRHDRRPAHPSLLPAPRPILVEVSDRSPVETQRRLPGGATLVERRPNPGVAELRLVGETDVVDRGAIIDACTAVVLEGARHLRIDGTDLDFVDLRILETLATVALHCRRLGGSFELVGLREPFSSLWARLTLDTTAPAPRGRRDDRVVLLRTPVSAHGEPDETRAVRVVPDTRTGEIDPSARLA